MSKSNLREAASKLVADLKEFSIVANEPCPEGHRKDPKSGACLPMGSTDHTAFTRSVNDDQGDLWRGLKDKAEENKEEALDASDMEEFESCPAGTLFSFVQKKCVTPEEADAEDAGERAFEEDADGHSEVVALDPEGRRDPVGFDCPPQQFFDFKLRECIPLNKDTVLASEAVDEVFKQEVANNLSGRLAVTSCDPLDGHKHLVTVDENGDGKTSVAMGYGEKTVPHSHNVAEYLVEDYSSEGYTSKHFGHVIPKELYEYEENHGSQDAPVAVSTTGEESAAVLKSKQRKSLPDSSFGVPGKRKFPLHDCSHVRNAMSRFNQAKGLTPSEKATLRRKILSKAKGCSIDVKKFGKANTSEEFAAIVRELELKERVMSQYSADADKKEETVTEPAVEVASKQGPCPPGMEWAAATKSCGKMKGFYEFVKAQANHSDVVALDPAGRKDPVGFQCPSGSFFDFATRKCVPLDPSRKEGTTTTKAATEEGGSKVLAPNPAGRPARLPSDCPAGTIWDGDLEDCKPLDSRKKTKSEEEVEEDAKCAPKGKKKMKGESAGSEGLVPAPAGQVKLASDCPAGTAWDGATKTCTPLDSGDKNRPSGSSPQSPKSTAAVDSFSIARVIQQLDAIIKEEAASSKEKARTVARDLPNEAFPPSLVGSTRRSLMHHNPEVVDAYDTASVDIPRLRNALARVDSLDGYAAKALEDAREHLLYHAKEILKDKLGKS